MNLISSTVKLIIDVVILALDDYNSWMETHYLLSNRYNAERLLTSLKKARAGEVFEREVQ